MLQYFVKLASLWIVVLHMATTCYISCPNSNYGLEISKQSWKNLDKIYVRKKLRKWEKASCIEHITGGLYPGANLTIIGYVLPDSRNIFINLCEELVDGTIVMHFNPRPEDKVVVKNTFYLNKWGNEDRSKNNFPFKQGSMFKLVISADKEKFSFWVNGVPFTTYTYRGPLAAAKYLRIHGNLVVYHVDIQNPEVLSLEGIEEFSVIDQLKDDHNRSLFMYGFIACVIASVVIGVVAGATALVYKSCTNPKYRNVPVFVMETRR